MPRIRTFKPDFWSDSKMVKLSPYARLFYMGMWSFALCDHGHLPDDAEELKLKILPADPVDPDELLAELIKLDRVRRMVTDDGQTFLWVVRLDNHQKLDERWKTRCPYCAAPRVTPQPPEGTHGNSRESHWASPENTASHPVVGSKGRELVGDGGSGGPASTVTRPRAVADLEPPPTNEPVGPAEKILTDWRDSLRSPVQPKILDQVGTAVVAALHAKVPPDDVAEGLRLWQRRGNLGPGMLPTLIHEVSQRVPSTDLVPAGSARSPTLRLVGADPRPSTTDARVAANLALADELRAEREARRGA